MRPQQVPTRVRSCLTDQFKSTRKQRSSHGAAIHLKAGWTRMQNRRQFGDTEHEIESLGGEDGQTKEASLGRQGDFRPAVGARSTARLLLYGWSRHGIHRSLQSDDRWWGRAGVRHLRRRSSRGPSAASFGQFGDRFGRKEHVINLMSMGAATVISGACPTIPVGIGPHLLL